MLTRDDIQSSPCASTERPCGAHAGANVKAAEKMAGLHDLLKGHGYDGHGLRVYLVRLLFCLFAGDTGIFPQNSLRGYIEKSAPDGSDLSARVNKLFEVLDMPPEAREKRTLLSDELKQFRHINGKLFSERLPSAEFDSRMRQALLECLDFDWDTISPAIFGAMFQGVMDAAQRREMGAHYTSEENILKLIDPLFLDGLWEEFDRAKADPAALDVFHEKIARLKFLDPACGCGNFLIIAYREMRALELEVLKMKIGSGQMVIDITRMLKVGVEQFYGIEYEEFPCQIAQVGMWLMDHQMNLRASEQFGTYYARLPLTRSATIVHGNALRLDWEGVVPKRELSYIMGNPPFVGCAYQNGEQKTDVLSVCADENKKPFKNAGKIDYVAAWYYKAAKYLHGTQIGAAFVSTNSITQGEQVAAIWKPLLDMFGIRIDFAYRTFKWTNEAKGKAAVHCVIVGFSAGRAGARVIFDGENKVIANNINPYLVDGPDIFVESRTGPLGGVPEMRKGNMPIDGGNLIIEANEYENFLSAEPRSANFIRRFVGADEFINGRPRYCLWLAGAAPSELRSMPALMARVEKVRGLRASSPREATRRKADTPALFGEIRQPDTDFLAVPEVSSERRRYIPIGYLSASTIVSNKIFTVANAALYHFGVLTSNVHNAWARAVCGRLKSDYSYSNIVVYNNFPWPDADDGQQAAIGALAQAVLDARALFPGSSLADLYDPLTMPPELLRAHQGLDRAVMRLYGLPVRGTTEAGCVAALMGRYQMLAAGAKA